MNEAILKPQGKGTATAAETKEVGTPVLGILMLETCFPRPPGDIGHPATFNQPVVRHVVKDASPKRVVHQKADGLLPNFVEGAQLLEQAGADIITTSCGFLTLFQEPLQDSVKVPVFTSILFDIPKLESALPAGKRAGTLTISATSLSKDHLKACGVPADAPVVSPAPDGEFCSTILGNRRRLDLQTAEAELMIATQRLVEDYPDVGVIVLECTNMEPYAAAISKTAGVPTVSLVSTLRRRLFDCPSPGFRADEECVLAQTPVFL